MWKKLIKQIAPSIASTIGTPLAGMGVKAILNAVWPNDTEKTEDDLEELIQNGGLSPDHILAIKNADNQFKLKMKEMNVDLSRLDYDDAKDARAREVALKDKMPAILAILAVVMFAGALFCLFKYSIPEANKAIVYSMIGALGTITVTAYAYYHGSSRGSARKNEIMASQMEREGHVK